jgi:hypothetical protein
MAIVGRVNDSGAADSRSEFPGRSVTLWPLQPAPALAHYRHANLDN